MPVRNLIFRAPLVLAAAVAVAGILLDRYALVPGPIWAIVVGVGLASCLFRQVWLPVTVVIAGFAGLHHHIHRNWFAADDIGFAATDEPRLVQMRGQLIDEPTFDPPVIGDPLRSVPEAGRTRVVMEAEQLGVNGEKQSVSGRVAVTLVGNKSQIQAGDVLLLTGWLARPRTPDNPGERDHASALLDDRIRATLLCRHTSDADEPTIASTTWSCKRLVSWARAWAKRQLNEQLPTKESQIAAALLLGDGAAMSREDWQRYIRTGVVHVLAVSGQHLSILAGFAWIALRGPGISRRWAAVLIALGIVSYGALTGNRPPVARAVIMVVVFCLATLLRRPARLDNSLALAAVLLLVCNPADLADPGCQFSFLSVAILIYGTTRWLNQSDDSLQRLEVQIRPPWLQFVRGACRAAFLAFLISFVLGLVLLPLSAAHYHLVSPIGMILGPPAILLSAVALIFGFLQLLVSAILPPAALIVAPITAYSLSALMSLVQVADRVSGGSFYVGDISIPWLIGFYVMLAAALWVPSCSRHPGRCLIVGLSWTVVGLAISLYHVPPNGLVTTFLAVGHGGATVMELPDGRVILFDAGSMSGPDITRRVIAPYLWHRNIRRIDDVILSHADLDHFNGLPSAPNPILCFPVDFE